jgi:hypothetical protein
MKKTRPKNLALLSLSRVPEKFDKYCLLSHSLYVMVEIILNVHDTVLHMKY